MALQQRKVLGKVTINHQAGGHCEVQHVMEIYDDVTGDVVSEKFHRVVVDPGDDIKARECGVKHITDSSWTAKMRQKEKDKKNKESKKVKR